MLKHIFTLILLGSAVLLAQGDDEIKQLPAGIIASFKQEFVNEYQQLFNQQFLEKFQQLNFPTVENHQYFSIFDVYYQIKNIKIHETKYNSNQTEISLHEQTPNFYMNMVDCVFSISFDYHIKTTPELIEDVGVGKAWLRDLNMTIKASPRVYDRFFQIDFDEISIDVQDFGLDMLGGDVSVAVDFFSDTFKVFFREYLLGQMNDQTKDAFQGVFNDLLLAVPRDIRVSGGNLSIDYGLTSDGIIVTDDYLSIIMDGTFHLTNESEPTQKNFTTMPVHVASAEEVQIMISEYSLNELLTCAVKLNLIQYVNYDQTSDNVDAIVTEFEDALGQHSNVTLIIQAARDLTKYKPIIKISEAGSLIEFVAEIHILNPLDVTIDAAVIIARTKANITFSVNEDFELLGAVNDLKLTIEEFYPYFYTKTTKENISSRLSLLVTLMESYANGILDDGYALPISKNITRYILKEKVTEYDGFLLIDGDADFTQNFTDFNFDLMSAQPFIQTKLRNLQQDEQETVPVDEPVAAEDVIDSVKVESMDRFYGLVKKVYVHKLEHNEYTSDNYKDVYMAVDDIMAEYNTGNSTVGANWTDDMKADHKEVTQDFKDGKLTWGDISTSTIRSIGNDIMKNIEDEIDDTYKAIKSTYLGTVSSLIALENSAEKEAKNIIDHLFRSFGGGRL